MKFKEIIGIYLRKFKKYIFGGATIILYHRVDTPKEDPLMLSVSPENFRTQLKYLKDNYKVVSLSVLANKIKNKESIRNHVVVTFDDGYRDNFEKALPILEELQLPATIFIVSGKINSTSPFFWDENLDKESAGVPLQISLLEKLSKSNFVEIGAHTINHPHLSDLSEENQVTEISGSKKQIEDIIKKDIQTFSYPFGSSSDFNNKTKEIVNNSNFICACANRRGFVYLNSDLFELPRNLVRNYDIKKFKLYSL